MAENIDIGPILDYAWAHLIQQSTDSSFHISTHVTVLETLLQCRYLPKVALGQNNKLMNQAWIHNLLPTAFSDTLPTSERLTLFYLATFFKRQLHLYPTSASAVTVQSPPYPIEWTFDVC